MRDTRPSGLSLLLLRPIYRDRWRRSLFDRRREQTCAPTVVGAFGTAAAARNLGAVVETFHFAAHGRAVTMEAGEIGGFVRIVSPGDDHRILGIQAIGAHVSELSGEFASALEMDAVAEDIARKIHAHPTLSEAVQEAALRRLYRT